MATLTSVQAADTFPVTQPNSGAAGKAYGAYAVATNPAQNDILEMCKLPKGAIVTGGHFYSDALETSGSPTLAVKCGYAGDTDAFFTAATGDYTQNTRLSFPLFPVAVAHTGATALAAETTVFLTWTATAATFAAGNVFLEIDYILPVGG